MQQARDNLRYTLPELRKAAPRYLQSSSQSIGFITKFPYQLDIEHFYDTAKNIEKSSIAQLREAIDLHQDLFLAGFRVRNAPAFETWVTAKQQEYQALMLQMQFILAKRYIEREEYHAALTQLQQLLTLDPLHEEGHQLQMRALAATGQRAVALSVYQQLAERLQAEMGLNPDSATTALYEQLRLGETALRTSTFPPKSVAASTIEQFIHYDYHAASHNLPKSLTPFLGRAAEVTDLCKLVRQGTYRAITIFGEGGIGKTRLALAVAHQMMQERSFADGVWFVPLADIIAAGNESPSDADETRKMLHQRASKREEQPHLTRGDAAAQTEQRIVLAIGQALSLQFQEQTKPAEQLLHFLRDKQLLLVLDNYEHLVADVHFIVTLLKETERVQLMVTSRQVLSMQAEYCWSMSGLSLPPEPSTSNFEYNLLHTYDSIALFQERVRRVLPTFTINRENGEWIARICQLLQGMPLGIELAAAQVADRTCWEIYNTLAHDATALSVTFYDMPPRQRSLYMVLEDSWRLLTAEEQQVLRACSVFRGGFSLDAIQTIMQKKRIPLAALLAKSMLQQEETGRYYLHEVIRQFAATQLSASNAAHSRQIHERHMTYYLAMVQKQGIALIGSQFTAASAMLQINLPNIQKAWYWAITHRAIRLLGESCQGLFFYYHHSHRASHNQNEFIEAIGAIEAEIRQLSISTQKQSKQQVEQAVLQLEEWATQLRCIQANENLSQSKVEEAPALICQIIPMAQKHQWPYLIAQGLTLEGHYFLLKGEYERAKEQLTAAVTCADSLVVQDTTTPAEIDYLRTSARIWLGRRATYQAEYQTALQLIEKALQLARRNNSLITQINTLINLAHIHWHLGNFEQTKTCSEEALTLANEHHVEHPKPTLLNMLGSYYDYIGDYSMAQEHYQAALQKCYRAARPVLQASILGNLGISADYVGNYKAALTYSQASLQKWQALAVVEQAPIVLINLALHCHHLENAQKAIEYSERALTISKEIGNLHLQSYAWTMIGHANSDLAQWKQAEQAYNTALDHADQMSLTYMTIEPLAGLVRIAVARQDPTGVAEHLQEILAYLSKSGTTGLEEPLHVYLTCYEGLQMIGSPQANQILQNAVDLLQQRASKISEPVVRQGFLNQVVAHRRLMQYHSESIYAPILRSE